MYVNTVNFVDIATGWGKQPAYGEREKEGCWLKLKM